MNLRDYLQLAVLIIVCGFLIQLPIILAALLICGALFAYVAATFMVEFLIWLREQQKNEQDRK